MARAFNKEIRRSITGSLGRFIAIAIIAALGCGFYAGLRMTPLDMDISADTFYDDTNLCDVRVVSTLGFEDEDVATIAAVEGVENVTPTRQADTYALIDNTRYVLQVNELDVQAAAESDCSSGTAAVSSDESYMNRPVLTQGTWPQAADECVVCVDGANADAITVGAQISLVDSDGDLDSTFAQTTFTVVGIAISPYYICTTNFGVTDLGAGEVEVAAYVGRAAFAEDLPYTGVYVTVAGAKDATYPYGDYDAVVDPVVERIESLNDTISAERCERLKADALSTIEKNRAKLSDKRVQANKKIDKAQAKIDDSAAELEQAAAKLESSKSQLESAREQLESGEEQLQAAQAQIEESAQKLESAQAEYESGLASYNENATSVAEQYDAALEQIAGLKDDEQAYAQAKAQIDEQFASAFAQLETAKAKLDAAKQQITQGKAELESGKKQVKENKAKLAKARKQYESGYAQYKSGVAQLESGQAELEEGQAELDKQKSEAERRFARAEKKLDRAQQKVDDMEQPEIYVLDRSKNYGNASRVSDAERVDKIAAVFPFLFFLVAALVALTTMTRMVDEERILIGTFKALGYSRARTLSKYLAYAFAASASGCVVGMLILTQFLPGFIMRAYGIIYAVPVYATPIDAQLAGMAAGLTVGIICVVTAAAVAATLREKPAALMLPRAPKAGKRILIERITPLWRRLTFTGKVTARNIFRYKQRFFMAVVGVAGCTGLLLTGFGLNNGINDIIDIQFDEILEYNLEVQLSDGATDSDHAQVEQVFDESPIVSEYAALLSTSVLVQEGESDDLRTTLMVPEDPSSIDSFIHLRERVGHAALSLEDGGVVITEKIAIELGLEAGDTLTVYEQDTVGERTGEAHEVVVTGINEYYIGRYVFMTPACYKATFGKDCEMQNYVVKAPGTYDERAALTEELLATDAVAVSSYFDEAVESYRTMLSTVNAVCVVLVCAAAVLAFVVLYNLTNININERRREIATLKVLGFTPREVNAYIYRETMLLTLIGALVGCVLGTIMSGFVISTAEVDSMMFGRTIHAWSYVVSFALTLLFGAIVTVLMKRKLTSIDMVESLKSVE